MCIRDIQVPYIDFGTRRNQYEQALNYFELIETKQNPHSSEL